MRRFAISQKQNVATSNGVRDRLIARGVSSIIFGHEG